jgi:UPF0271 protein
MARQRIDLNCDMGELADGATDAALLDVVSSANIACGFHAGSAEAMRRTVDGAVQRGVAIGAHPSLDDREGFGRRELPVTPEQAYEQVLYQIGALEGITRSRGGKLHHVKPHGALYNMAARNSELANAIARAVRDFDTMLILYGLAGSHLLSEAGALGLRTASEVFADRAYQPDGSLTPRSQPHALIEDEDESVAQVHGLVEGRVCASDGTIISVEADTVCLHGDQPGALAFAMRIRRELAGRGIVIEAPQ